MEHQIQIITGFTSGLFILVSLFATIIGLKNFKKIGFYSIFIIITASSFIQLVSAQFILNMRGIEDKIFKVNLTVHLYIIIELAILTYFFFIKIKSKRLRNVILSLNCFLFSILLFNFFTNNNFITEYYSSFVAIEAIINLIGCIFIFIQILDEDSNTPLLETPDFIITSGFFFFFGFTCPGYILTNYFNIDLVLSKFLSIQNALVYIILYVTFVIAYLCKIRSSKSY